MKLQSNIRRHIATHIRTNYGNVAAKLFEERIDLDPKAERRRIREELIEELRADPELRARLFSE